MAKLTNTQMLEAIYKKVCKSSSSNAFSASGSSLPVEPAKPLPAQWNLRPWDGAEVPPTAPKGFHWEFDYANKVVGLFKSCGPLGG
jgi:hypothetical protein